VRALLVALTSGRTELTAAQARWCEQARRTLADAPLIERLERAEIAFSQREGALIARIITTCLADNGIDARDPAIGADVARRIREIVAADGRGR
jgi:hypothetical protein